MLDEKTLDLIFWAYKQGYFDAAETLKTTYEAIDESKLKEQFLKLVKESTTN